MTFPVFTCRRQIARILLGMACAMASWTGSGFAQTLFSESFDGSWTTPPTLLTGGAAWSGTTTPANNVWHRNDYTAGWNSASGAYTPTGALGTTNSARFHSFDAGINSVGTLITPSLDMSAAPGNKRLSFWFLNTSGTDSLLVWLSTDDGASYPTRLTGLATAAAWTRCVVNLGTTTSATVRVKFEGKSDFGSTDYGLDEVKIAVASPLSGTKIIGSGGDYATFTAAIAALNLNGVGAGGVTFTVAAGTTFTEDPNPVVSGAGSDSTHPVTFVRSGSGANPVLRPAGTNSSLDAGFALVGADWVTWNGIDIVENTGSALEYGVLLRNMSSLDGATNNTIRDCTITLNRANTASYAVLQTSSTLVGGGITAGDTGGANSSNRYLNLTITNTFSGIGLVGGTVAWPDANNSIGVASGGVTTIGAATANDIGSGTLSGGAIYGVRLDRQSGARVSGIRIRNINSTSTTPAYGIFLDNSISGGALAACEISNNSIFNITSTSTSSSAAILYGMRVDLSTGNSASVFNNEVYNFTPPAPAGAQTAQYVRAIAVNAGGSGGTVTLSHNSVSLGTGLAGNQLKVSTTCYYQAGGSVVLRNNIFANLTPAQTTSKHFALVVASGTASSASNNLYHAPNTNGVLGNVSNADYATLPLYAAAISGVPPVDGAEAGSADANPNFTSATALTFAGATPAALSGTPVAGITTDLTGAARSLTRPTIGARETANALDDRAAPVLTNVSVTGSAFPAVSVTLTDNSAALARATVRLWYRIATDTDPFVGVDADTKPAGAMNGVYTWSTALAGLPSGTYAFYIAARDSVGAGLNVWANPIWSKRLFTGFSPDDPPDFFENPASYANVRFFTKTDPQQYTLTRIASLGSIAAAPDQAQYTEGTTVTLTAVPSPGYAFTGWSGDLSGSVNPSPLLMDANKTVTANFAPQTFAITATAGTRGSIAPTGTTMVSYGNSVSFAITPDAHAHIADVLVDGASVGAVGTYTFSNVSAAHTISASFAIDSFTVTLSAGPHGQVTPSGAIAVQYGDSLAVAIAADAGYHVEDVLVDGVSAGAITGYTFAAVAASHTLSATFAGDLFDSVRVSAPAMCLTPAHACGVFPVTIVRNDPAGARGFSVALQLTNLQPCVDAATSFVEGSFLRGPGAPTQFQVVDQGGGAYTIDGVLLGQPCGATAQADTLFTLDLRSGGVSGTGSVAFTAVSLRDCFNVDLRATSGAAATVTIDQAPVALASIAPQSVLEGSTLTLTPNLTLGPCAVPPIAWTATGLPAGASFNAQTGGVTWVTDCASHEGGPGYGPIVVVAREAGGDSARISVPVTVLDNPGTVTVTAIGDKSVLENATLTVTPSAGVAGCAALPLTWTASGLPPGAQVNAGTGVLTWTPACNAYENGPAYGPVRLVARAATGEADSASFTITVRSGIALAPIAPQAIAEGSALSVIPSVSYPGCVASSVSFRARGLPPGATIDTATGQVSWTPGCRAFEDGPSYGPVTVTVTAAGGERDSTEFSVSVSNSPGTVSVAAIPNASVAETAQLTITPFATLAGCAEGPTSWTATGLPPGASFNATTGVLIWVPSCTAFESGPQYGPVTLTAHAATGESGGASFLITVSNASGTIAVNVGASQSVAETQLLTVTPTANLPACAAGPVSWGASGLPAGAAINSSTGGVTWTPGCRGFEDGPSYGPVVLQATAASGETGSATFTIQVTNTPGTVSIAAISDPTITETQTLTITPVATIGGCAEGPLAWTAQGLPSGATLSASTGVLTWVVGTTAYESGPNYPVTLTATAPTGAAGNVSFTIHVINATATIAATSPSFCLTTQRSCLTIPVTLVRNYATPVRGVSVTFHLSSLLKLCGPETVSLREGTFMATGGTTAMNLINNGGGVYTVDISILGSPCGATGTSGTLFTLDVTYASTSGSGSISVSDLALRNCVNVAQPATAGANASVTIDLMPITITPIPNKTVDEGTMLEVTPVVSLSGCAVGPLTWTATGMPSGATLNATTGVFRWTPSYTAYETGPTYGPVTLTAHAASGETAPVAFSITVTNVNNTTDVGDVAATIPAAMYLGTVAPSPSRGRAQVHYGLHVSGPVRLAVYDIAGRLVRVLVAGSQVAGERVVSWNGADDAGRGVVSGLYVLRLEAEGSVARRALHIVR